MIIEVFIDLLFHYEQSERAGESLLATERQQDFRGYWVILAEEFLDDQAVQWSLKSLSRIHTESAVSWGILQYCKENR